MVKNTRKRLRDLGITIGKMPTGPMNAITDVAGVKVGHSTIIRGTGKQGTRRGAIRTGVTAILPSGGNEYTQSVKGGAFVLNGAGEVSGLTQIMEWGIIETPILLTNTLSVGSCGESVVKYMVQKYPEIGGRHDVVIPIVGECDDSWLNDIAGTHVVYKNVVEALESASSGPVAEGSVGGGTGMITCDFKAGIGTSSRIVSVAKDQYSVGVLVMSNFGEMEDLRLDGAPVGRKLLPQFADYSKRRHNYGSIIAVLATDAPFTVHQLNRLSKRVGLGIGRVGSYAANGSGEIILAFSTANKIERFGKSPYFTFQALHDTYVNPFYIAALEATEEAIWNALTAADSMHGANGHFVPAVPLGDLKSFVSSV
ncbi:MAG: P1 family peptidase [Bdellovibrionota bacterium]